MEPHETETLLQGKGHSDSDKTAVYEVRKYLYKLHIRLTANIQNV